MNNRGMIKWQPFNAVIPGKYMVNSVLKEKNKIKRPILSEDQLREIEEKIFTAYKNDEVVKIKLYKSGKFYMKKGIIKNIDKLSHKITLNDGYCMFFEQIIEFC